MSKISESAVKQATNKTWNEWHQTLSKENASNMSHKEIVSLLRNRHKISHWWAQTITVDYEKLIKRRLIGQTVSTGFQVGVQTTLNLPLKEAWNFLMSSTGIITWLGVVPDFDLSQTKKYQTENGVIGEIRVFRPFHHIRLSWKPKDWSKTSTLQFTVVSNSPNKTSIRVHHEKLADAKTRIKMKNHWNNVLGELKKAAPVFF